ncbi:MAG: hypothetical protein LBT21_04640 [Oscillospiraceae bacterium]|jgi:hypothetical protein|nr:hypothetical protein [Oscillospiraceae bacterium]
MTIDTDTIKAVLEALAKWFVDSPVATTSGASVISENLGDFVKGLLDTIVHVVFGF